MAALTKIFSGMEKGPEAINSNFTALSVQRTAGFNVTGNGLAGDQLDKSKSNISFFRVGNIVLVFVDVYVTREKSGNWFTVLNSLPTGFHYHPIRADSNAATQMMNMVWPAVVTNCWIGPDQKMLFNTNDSGAEQRLTGTIVYHTDDDFPA